MSEISAGSLCGDDTLIAKYLDYCSPSRTEGRITTEIGCKTGHNINKTVNIKLEEAQQQPCNDSVFSDIDLSYVEKNLQASTRTGQSSVSNGDGHLSKASTSLHSVNDGKVVTFNPVTPAHKHPNPIAASTPSSNRRKSLSEKMAERLAIVFLIHYLVLVYIFALISCKTAKFIPEPATCQFTRGSSWAVRKCVLWYPCK